MRDSVISIFLVFLRLGLTSFGGPVAHLGYFRTEFVARRRWLNDAAYADLVALCQLLPGPASSQVGIALGLSRAGYPGALAAWLGFTAPSALALIVFGLILRHSGLPMQAEWLHGLKVVAVAVVAQALWSMGRTLCPDPKRASVAVIAACVAIAFPGAAGQIAVILGGAVAGTLLPGTQAPVTENARLSHLSRRAGLIAIALFLIFLLGLPVLAQASGDATVGMIDVFYRIGSIVFGGGHVVLPLLQSEVVPRGWVSNDLFLAGYGAAQAVPGPLFTFAAFIGSVSAPSPNGWAGGLIAVAAIFLPSFFLVCGSLPFLEALRRHENARKSLAGISAAVVGLLLAALYDPVWTSAIRGSADFALAAVAYLLLVFWKWAPWIVVVLAALGAAFLGYIG
jgi:chromate transporter